MKKSGDGLARVAMPIGRHVSNLWRLVYDSLWFVPALFVVGAVVLGIVMVEISSIVPREALVSLPRLFGADASGSRGMLSTIAGAMVTVAGVTFSITVVAVAQASSMYTPRILRNFMRDRPSQLVLGMLVGTFVYCLVVIRTIRGQEDARFIPAIAVLTAFVLAIVAIGVLVYFIHHVAGSLQASGILARVTADTTAAVKRLFPDDVGEEATPDERDESTFGPWFAVPAYHTGYIRGVDAEGMLAFAAERDLVVRMARGIGEHVIATSTIAEVGPCRLSETDARALSDLYDVGVFRTVGQDAEFGMRQIVDMAVKALSPGVNDTTTATTCIDSIGTALVALANRRIEDRYRERDGRVRVIARGPSFESLTHTAFDEIRQNAAGNVSVLSRLLATLDVVAERTSHPARRAVLLAHAERILAVSERTVPDAYDRGCVRALFDRVRHALTAPDAATRLVAVQGGGRTP